MSTRDGARPDNTGEQQAPRWRPGESGNPHGRPKGSRNKLSETFLKALADDFETNGAGVIQKVREERPHDYLKVCASVMPRRLESEDVTNKDVRQMSDAELEAILWKSAEEVGGISEKDIEAAGERLAKGEGASKRLVTEEATSCQSRTDNEWPERTSSELRGVSDREGG